MHKMLFTMMSLAATVAPAFAAEWMTDMDAAKQKAAAENKAVLVDFTGSDWCGYCIQLKKNVFDKPDFDAYAKDKFVLLEVDVPRNPKFDKEQLKKNRELCEQFNVSGYPTILVLTPQGDVAGGFVGGRPGLDSVKQALDPALANAKALEAASKLTGEEQVKALAACYKALPDGVKESAKPLRDRILSMDPNDVSGLQAEVKAEQQLDEFGKKIEAIGDDPKALLTALLAMKEEALPPNKPLLLNAIFNLQMMTAESVEDLEKAKKTLDESAALLPEEKENIEQMKAELFADPAALLEKIKQRRENSAQ